MEPPGSISTSSYESTNNIEKIVEDGISQDAGREASTYQSNDIPLVSKESETRKTSVSDLTVATAVLVDSFSQDGENDQSSCVLPKRLSDTSCYVTYKDQVREYPIRMSVFEDTWHGSALSETETPQTRDDDPLIISSRNVSAIEEKLPVNNSSSSFQDAVSEMIEQGFPRGLATEMAKNKQTYKIRYWIIDNSGSMLTPDCKRFVQHKEDNTASCLVNSTRWNELQESVKFQIDLAGILEAETVFRLLNDPGSIVGPQEVLVRTKRDASLAHDVISRVEPNGVTPLTNHLLTIRDRIELHAEPLRQAGQKAVVVIATDSLPSNEFGDSNKKYQKEFEAALKSLQTLPVWIVVRLCSNNKAVVYYYQHLDKMLEHNLEVIGDFQNESLEIFRFNSWLNYCMPLHRCREMGFRHRVFDLLDERPLNKDELVDFLKLLLGSDVMEKAPNIHTDWSGFYNFIAEAVSSQGKHWNARTMKIEDLIDMRRLNWSYGDGVIRDLSRKITDYGDSMVGDLSRKITGLWS